MRLSHLLVVLFASGLAGLTVWQAELHRRAGYAELVLQEVRAVCPANLVRFPVSGNLLLETGIAWDEQPEAWRRETLARLQAAHGSAHIWQVCGAQYRGESGELLPVR